MNDPRHAMLYFKMALSFAWKAKERLFRAYTLNDMGMIRLQQNQPVLAEQYHEQALKEAQAVKSDLNGIAETQALLADAQTAQGKYNLALGHYHDALKLQEQTGDVIGQAQTHFSMGMLESRRKRWPNAQEELAQAADIYHQVHHRVGESNARFRVAEVLAAEGNQPEAGREVDQAITLAEEVRNFTPGADLRAFYFASIDQMYRFQIDQILNAQGPVAESSQVFAFERFQHAQSRTLLDKLRARVGGDILSVSNPEAAQKEAEQERKLAGLLNSKTIRGEERGSFESVRKLEVSLKETDAKLLSGNPKLGIFSDIASVQDIQQRILDSESALVQFFLSDPYSYAWIVARSSIRMVRLPSKKMLERDIRRSLRFGLAGEWRPGQQAAVVDLRRKLGPVFVVASARRWIVVPDAGLHYFPFALLTSVGVQDNGPKEIVKIPSASTVDVARRTSNVARPAYALAIFADPVFDRLDSAIAKGNRSPEAAGDFLPRLLYSSREAEDISRLFPPGQSRLWLRFAATKEAVMGADLQDFQTIHLATHSSTDELNPDRSRIVLSRISRDGKPRPGEVLLKDIYRLKLSADLVVLSSCQSALGKQQAGEGPISLSRAFLFAGAKSVVASLWEVNDDATRELMQKFYTYMRTKKMPPSTALAQAQTDFRKHSDKRLRNPFYWAGFELYGEWRAH
jgi:tetratricopeptide (TPR) repeat protein